MDEPITIGHLIRRHAINALRLFLIGVLVEYTIRLHRGTLVR
jgi:hypothetical protein